MFVVKNIEQLDCLFSAVYSAVIPPSLMISFYTWSSIASCSALACRSPRYSWRLHSSWKSQWLGFSISASAPHAIYIHWGPNHQTDASAIVVLIDLMNRFYGNVVFILGKPSFQKSAVFLNIVQKAFAPPPLLFEHLSYFAGGVF